MQQKPDVKVPTNGQAPQASDPHLTRSVANWLVSTTWEQLPPPVVDAASTFILDHFGVAIAGARETSSRIVAELAGEWSAFGPCTVLGARRGATAPLAALANATSAHALELDDTHREATLHPGVSVIPAAYAIAQQQGSSGKDLVLAVALGYELMIRLGKCHHGRSHLRGFHTTGTCGSIAAAAAAAKLLGLDTGAMVSALGLGATQSAGLGTFRSNGAWSKRLHAGHAAHAGVLAASLAQRAFRGPSETFINPEGWVQAYAFDQSDSGMLTRDLGERWEMLDTSIKVHACCRFAAPIVDAMLAAATAEDIKADEVEEIVVGMASFPLHRSLTQPKERKYNPQSIVDAQFSLPFAAAVAIVRRRAFLAQFSEAGIRDPEVLALAQRVRWVVDEDAERAWPKRYSASVEIRLRSGRTVRSHCKWPKGDPENPVTAEELKEKFLSLTEPVLEPAGAAASYERLRRPAAIASLAELTFAPA